MFITLYMSMLIPTSEPDPDVPAINVSLPKKNKKKALSDERLKII